MNISIQEGNIAQVVALSLQIPEFVNPYPATIYEEKMKDKKHLILLAYVENHAVGFKVGYERMQDGSFYSWMGGVLPAFRKKGIAKQLAIAQHTWAKAQGYQKIRFKTRNCHRNMLLMAISDGFQIIDVEPKEQVEEYRIWLEKAL